MIEVRNGYEPFEKQQVFHNSTAKFRGIITGVGFGKSCAGANETIKACIEYPLSTHLILAPTSKILNNASLAQFWKFCPPEFILQHRKSESVIILVNGAKIIYLTADNERHVDRLRGIEIGSFWADEGSLLLYKMWQILMGRLRDPGGPLRGWITCTPKGYNWLYYLFVRGVDPLSKKPILGKNYYEWFTGTSMDNPYTPEEFKQNLLLQWSGVWAKQEIYGEFTGFEGQVYDNFRPAIHVLKAETTRVGDKVVVKPGDSIIELRRFVGGIDWGFTHPMAACIIGFDNDGRAYVVELFYAQRKRVPDLSSWIHEKQAKYGKIRNWYADPSEPGLISELRGYGHGVMRADNNVLPGINTVYGMFSVVQDNKPRLFILQNCGALVDELNEYRYADKVEGKVQKDEPIKVHDDACDSIRYALHTDKKYSTGAVLFDDPKRRVFGKGRNLRAHQF